MRGAFALASIVTVAVAIATPSAQSIAPPLSPRNANYTITARLDPPTRTVIGTETIVWRNITNTTTTELRFHLYWNAWKNARTTFMREQALAGFGGDPLRQPGDWSHIEITSIKLTEPVARCPGRTWTWDPCTGT